ncbi:glucoamylase family protein [Marinactinospora rubrisoli]|uniref:Glucoamylase family protein n=1 Tax=Marinactinospora rubrisoli TaxID=2715399 RepID=A0ABW2KID4_9ACTN
MDRRAFLSAGATTALALGLPATAHASSRPRPAPGDTALLRRWFAATYRSIEAMTTEFGLAADKLDVVTAGATPSRQTSPTNIGCGLWSTVAARGLGVISAKRAARRLAAAVEAVERLERFAGFWANWYDAYDGSLLTTWPESGDPVRPFLSTVDNAWLVTGLMIAADAEESLRPRIARLLADADWSFFYTPYDEENPDAEPGQLRGGVWTDTGEPTAHHYGALNTEPRMASYLGIGDGTLPPEHYWHLLRTMRPEHEQQQKPGGEYTEVDGVRVWNGHYTYRGRRVLPSWGGSMFEALMVPLFVPEAEWSPRAWGVAHERYVRSHIEHGLAAENYGYWGFSPASVPEGGYSEYGVDEIGMLVGGYRSHGVVTPHASFLALQQAPGEAVANLAAMARDFDVYDEAYGFRDSIDVRSGVVSDVILVLDQGMIAAAIAQHLRPGLLQRPFRTGGFTDRVRPLLERERFTL